MKSPAGRVMVMFKDPRGVPRAWGISTDESEARKIAQDQLAKYRVRKREVGDPLADAVFKESVLPISV